jgi:branched-chain amino acid transport system substrate-binding protein
MALLAGEGPAIGAVRPLDSSSCSPMRYVAGAPPQLLLVADQALQGEEGALGNQMAEAVEYVLRAHKFHAGPYAIGYQACDDSTATEGGDAVGKCAANARAYAGNRGVVAVVGPTLSMCAAAELPILGRAPGGPVAIVSPSTTRVGLTRAGRGAHAGEPGRYYPRGVRNFVRLMAADDFQVAAVAMTAKRLGLRRVYVLEHAEQRDLGVAFRASAGKLGVAITGSGRWSADSPAAYETVARSVRDSGSDGVFLAGSLSGGGVDLLRALRAALPPDVRVLAPDGFSVPELLRESGRAANGLLVSVAGVAPEALSGHGRQMVEDLREALGEPPHLYSVYAAQATELLLGAIARSDGTRRSVVDELFASRVRGGILGDFDVTGTGDSTSNRVTIYRVVGGRLRRERVVDPPLSLVTGP